MKREVYYQLLSEYNGLIAQKRFNHYLVNRNRLCEVKKLLSDELKRKRRCIAEEIISGSKRGERRSYLWLKQERMEKLEWMLEKIQSEENLSNTDYADTYYEPKFIMGFTLPQFLIVAAVSAVVALIYWLLNY